MAEKKKKNEKWIQDAIKNPGSLREAAKREGGLNKDGTIKDEWLEKAAKSPNPIRRRRAILAKTLKKMNKG